GTPPRPRRMLRPWGGTRQHFSWRHCTDITAIEPHERFVDRGTSRSTPDYWRASEKRFNCFDPQSRYQFPVEPVVCGPICPYPSDRKQFGFYGSEWYLRFPFSVGPLPISVDARMAHQCVLYLS